MEQVDAPMLVVGRCFGVSRVCNATGTRGAVVREPSEVVLVDAHAEFGREFQHPRELGVLVGGLQDLDQLLANNAAREV